MRAAPRHCTLVLPADEQALAAYIKVSLPDAIVPAQWRQHAISEQNICQ
jgi:hypothetical protein